MANHPVARLSVFVDAPAKRVAGIPDCTPIASGHARLFAPRVNARGLEQFEGGITEDIRQQSHMRPGIERKIADRTVHAAGCRDVVIIVIHDLLARWAGRAAVF